MGRSLRGLAWMAAVVGGLAIVIVLAVRVLAGTSFGMERARRFAVGWLNDHVSGEVKLGHFTGTGLLGGVMIHDVEIRGANGRDFVRADSISAHYDWLRLVRGRIALDRVELFGANVRIERLPGDSAWNYQHILGIGEGEGAPGPALLIRFGEVRTHDTQVTVALPDESRGSTQFVTEETEGGRLRLLQLTGIEAWLGPVLLQSPDESDRQIRIRSFSGKVGIFAEPVVVKDAEGKVTLQDSVVNLDFETIELPASRFAVSGRVIDGQDGPRLDLRADGHADVADFRWFDDRVPGEGSADLDLHVETLADGSLSFRSERLDFKARGADIDGAFGLVLARTNVLQGVDLRIVRAETAWLDSILPAKLGVTGRLSGRIRADGPLNGIRTNGNLSLQRPGHERVAQVSWSGALAVQPDLVARQLDAELRDVDLDLIDEIRPGTGLIGRADGRVSLDGPLQTGMEMRGVLTLRQPAGSSVLDGVVTIARGETGVTTNGRFLGNPLRLEALNGVVPELPWLKGTARGAVAFDTRGDSIRVGANVAFTTGRADFGVVVELAPGGPVIDGSGTVTGFAPAAIGAPPFAGSLSGGFDFRMAAADLAHMSGSVHAALDSGTVHGFPVERSTAWLRFRDGMVTVDSAFARAPGVTGRAEGRFGLVGERTGELHARVTSRSIEPLESFVLGGIEDPTQPRLSGSLEGEASLRGSLASFDVDATAGIDHLVLGSRSAAALRIDLNAAGVRSDSLRWRLHARGDTVAALGSVADSLEFTVGFTDAFAQIDGETWSGGERTGLLSGVYRDARGGAGAEFGLDSLTLESGTSTWSLRQPTRIALGKGSARVADLNLVADSGGVARIAGQIAIANTDQPGTRPLDFTLDLDDVTFAALPHQIRPVGTVSGLANGQLRLTGTATEPVLDARFEVVGLSYEGARLERLGLDLRYRDELLSDSLSATIGGREVLHGVGAIPIDLRVGSVDRRILDLPVDMSVQLDSFPAAFAFGLLPGFSNIRGAFDGRMVASGSARDPSLTGALALRGGALTWDATGVRYVSAEGTFQMQPDLMARVDLTAQTAQPRDRTPLGGRGGSVRVTGTVDLTRAKDPGFALVLQADRMLATRRREAEIVLSGKATLDGHYQRPKVSGTLTVDGGSLYLDEIYRQFLIVGLEDPLFLDVIDTSLVSSQRVLPPTENPFLRNLLIENLQISVAAGSWLRSREMDVEVSGDLVIDFDRLQSDLRMSGTLNALRGTYRLEYPPFARIFEVRSGAVEFPGTPGIDPSLNIEAVYRARTSGGEPLDIYAVVSGTLQSPRVHLRSDTEPPISESDLASYLFLGLPTYAFNFGSAASGESGVFGGLGTRALTASGLGYFASGLQTLAQNFNLVDYVGLTAAGASGSSATQAGLGGLLAGTRIELGRYITPRIFVAYTQRLASENRGAGVRMEWRLTPTYTFEGFAEDRFARAPSFTLSQLIASRKVYGFFLFREWGY